MIGSRDRLYGDGKWTWPWMKRGGKRQEGRTSEDDQGAICVRTSSPWWCTYCELLPYTNRNRAQLCPLRAFPFLVLHQGKWNLCFYHAFLTRFFQFKSTNTYLLFVLVTEPEHQTCYIHILPFIHFYWFHTVHVPQAGACILCIVFTLDSIFTRM